MTMSESAGRYQRLSVQDAGFLYLALLTDPWVS